jgi:2-polyprenyl-6-methoxyphenol hydroxylase-like FAD-dependent oxidoreductase
VRIGVIGTGVAGSLFVAAAQSDLKHADVQAFDQIASNSRDDAGTGLNIGPNALKALRLHGGIAVEALRATSLPWRRWLIALTDGTALVDLDLLSVAEEPGIRIRWAELYSVLRTGSSSSTSYARTLEALEEDSSGRLVPVFRDASGELVRHGAFDLLVAADGRYSRLRELVDGAPTSDFPGIGTWRILVRDATGCPFDDLGQYFCGNARLLSFLLPNNCAYIAGTFSHAGSGPILDELKTPHAQRRLFQPATGVASPVVRWMLDKMERNFSSINWARTQEISILNSALDGRVLLLGDAAHATFQTLGQGATQAIEDALAAADVVRAKPASPRELCAAYQDRRHDRIEFMRRFTREATDTLLPGSDPVAGSLAKAQEPFLTKLRQLYSDIV